MQFGIVVTEFIVSAQLKLSKILILEHKLGTDDDQFTNLYALSTLKNLARKNRIKNASSVRCGVQKPLSIVNNKCKEKLIFFSIH